MKSKSIYNQQADNFENIAYNSCLCIYNFSFFAASSTQDNVNDNSEDTEIITEKLQHQVIDNEVNNRDADGK